MRVHTQYTVNTYTREHTPPLQSMQRVNAELSSRMEALQSEVATKVGAGSHARVSKPGLASMCVRHPYNVCFRLPRSTQKHTCQHAEKCVHIHAFLNTHLKQHTHTHTLPTTRCAHRAR